MRLGEIEAGMENTTHLRLVCSRRSNFSLSRSLANGELAASGASATIASDALMNPFDGECARFGSLLEM
jgi:hypothetical protein